MKREYITTNLKSIINELSNKQEKRNKKLSISLKHFLGRFSNKPIRIAELK